MRESMSVRSRRRHVTPHEPTKRQCLPGFLPMPAAAFRTATSSRIEVVDDCDISDPVHGCLGRELHPEHRRAIESSAVIRSLLLTAALRAPTVPYGSGQELAPYGIDKRGSVRFSALALRPVSLLTVQRTLRSNQILPDRRPSRHQSHAHAGNDRANMRSKILVEKKNFCYQQLMCNLLLRTGHAARRVNPVSCQRILPSGAFWSSFLVSERHGPVLRHTSQMSCCSQIHGR